jgi:LmbE family N-acetylglucosaminyl deacetylase
MPYLYGESSKKFLANVKFVNEIEKQKILAFAPHSDDLSIGAGGFLGHLSKKNNLISVCAYTGWRGVNNELGKKNAILIRENEMKKESHFLGAKKTIFLKLFTYESDSKNDINKDVIKIKNLINLERPSIIFLPNEKDLHPRHKLLASLILKAVKNNNKPVDLFFYEIPWSVFSGSEFNFIVPLDKESFNKKINAIKVHKSQLKRTNFVKLAKALLDLRAGMVPEQKISGYGTKSELSNWLEVYKFKKFK